jgi:hypothetical protein
MAADQAARMTRVTNVLKSINEASGGVRLTGGEAVPSGLSEAVRHTARIMEARGKPVQDMGTDSFAAFQQAGKDKKAAANAKRKGDLANQRVGQRADELMQQGGPAKPAAPKVQAPKDDERNPHEKAGKLVRMRLKDPALRDKKHDDAKGYHSDDSGKKVHSSGRKDTKKFANNTTFRSTPDDAMLHTDNDKDGARGDAGTDEFAFHGDVKKDPRQKWYRVSKQGGYASAMASLGKVYHKDPKMRAKVVSMVKSTTFPGAQGHQIRVKPTGAMHDERGPCVRDKNGALTQVGKALQRRDPQEWSRLCKGVHGDSSKSAERNEYERGFDPTHDDAHKVRKLHKAAEAGKADKPGKNIGAHADARPHRRQDVHDIVRSIGRKAARTKWRMRNG